MNVAMRRKPQLAGKHNKVLSEALQSEILFPFKRTWTPRDFFFGRQWDVMESEADRIDAVLGSWELEGSPAVCTSVPEIA